MQNHPETGPAANRTRHRRAGGPDGDPEGLELSLHVTALTAGNEITVTWNG